MPDLILARHGESEASLRGVLNGEAAAGVALTPAGRAQAVALGEALWDAAAGQAPALVVATAFARTQQTAELAAGRPPDLLLPGLNDPRFGAWEGRPLDEYRTWALLAAPEEPCPGGGESRVEVARRVADAVRGLLDGTHAPGGAPSGPVLVVAHSLPIRYLLDAAAGLVPAPRAERVPYAEPFRLVAAEAAAATELLLRWAAAPAWRSAR